jgi:hypothetical protein
VAPRKKTAGQAAEDQTDPNIAIDPDVENGADGIDPDGAEDEEAEEDEASVDPGVDPRPISEVNGLPIGGRPLHDPHPETPAKAEIIPEADFNISIRGVSLQFRDGKRAHVEPDVLAAIKAAGVPYKVAG